jgi:hypothetical protein
MGGKMGGMRRLLTLLLILALSGCASAQVVPAATPPPQPTISTVAERLVSPPQGRVEVIGYLYRTAQGASLVGGLSFSQGDIPTPLSEAGAIWLPSPPALPANTAISSVGTITYVIVCATGQLSSTGRYGPGGGYAYQLTDVSLDVLSVRDLNMKLLLDNSGIYDNQPVHLSGQILLGTSTALLVDQLGGGGVPTSSAQQIKLVGVIEGNPLRTRLTASSGGTAHFGPVQIIGIWRRSNLYPLAIIPG